MNKFELFEQYETSDLKAFFYNIISENCLVQLKSWEVFDILINKKVTLYYIFLIKNEENQLRLKLTKEEYENFEKLGLNAVNL